MASSFRRDGAWTWWALRNPVEAYETMTRIAREAEALGYDLLYGAFQKKIGTKCFQEKMLVPHLFPGSI